MIVASIRSAPAFGFMVIALIITLCGPVVAQKLRLPGLIGLLIGGALVGPNILGVLGSTEGIVALDDIGVHPFTVERRSPHRGGAEDA